MTKNILVAGLSALLILGFVAAADTVTDRANGRGMHGFFHGFGIEKADLTELGLSEDAAPAEIRSASFQKTLSELGLTEESTVRELYDAMEEEMQERHKEMLGKLGLSGDASPEEVRDAMKSYCEENPDDCPEKTRRGMGRMRCPPEDQA